MQVIRSTKLSEISGGKGIDAEEWAYLRGCLQAADAATSWGGYTFWVEWYYDMRAQFLAT